MRLCVKIRSGRKDQPISFFSQKVNRLGEALSLLRSGSVSGDPEARRSQERYRRALISGAASVFARLVWIFTLLITVPLTVDYLGAERYGLWMTISALITILQFADLGIGNGLLNAVAEASGQDDLPAARKYISSAFYCLVAISLLIGLGFAVAYPVIPWGAVYNVTGAQALAEAGPATALFAVLFLANISLGVVGRVQQGYQESYIDSLWQAAGRLAGLLGVLVIVWLQLGLPWLVFAMVGMPVLAQFANYISYFYLKKPELRPSLSQVTRDAASLILRTGILFFVLQLVVAVAFAADTIILAQIIGPEAVTVFTIAYQVFFVVPTLVRVLLGPLWPAYGEATSRGDFAWVKKTFVRSLKASLLLTTLAAIFLAFFGTWLIALWVGPEVQPPAILLLGLGLNSILLFGWGDPVAMFLNGTGRAAFEVVWAIPMALANIVLSILLTQSIGISGVAWGTSLSYFVLMVIPTAVYLRRILSSPEFANG